MNCEIVVNRIFGCTPQRNSKSETSVRLFEKPQTLFRYAKTRNHYLTCRLMKSVTCDNCCSMTLELATLLKSRVICFAGRVEQPNVECREIGSSCLLKFIQKNCSDWDELVLWSDSRGSYPSHWPCHQRRLANCDWMSASYTSGQPSNPRRHLTCWASSHWGWTVIYFALYNEKYDHICQHKVPVYNRWPPLAAGTRGWRSVQFSFYSGKGRPSSSRLPLQEEKKITQCTVIFEYSTHEKKKDGTHKKINSTESMKNNV